MRRTLLSYATSCALAAGVALAAVTSSAAGQEAAPDGSVRGNVRIKPFRIIGNVYYVGFSALGSFLVTTPEGHVLIDTTYPATADWVRTSIEELGFKPTDVKYVLNTHAHSDHVGGNAALQKITGAAVLAGEADVPVIADGGRSDFRSDGRELWPPMTPKGVRDGHEVRLGGTVLRAHATPGHTKGGTTWTTIVEENGRKYTVVFVSGMRLNEDVPLVGNPKYPNIVADYEKGFQAMKRIKPDVFLVAHAQHYNLDEKRRRLAEGATPSPFIDPDGYWAYVNKYEAAFREQLAKERGTR